MVDILKKLMNKEDLTGEEASKAIADIMAGQAEAPQTAAFLVALAMKGETGAELEALARGMRKAAVKWPERHEGFLLDTCGTGGDSAGILNISTMSAILLASLGISVAKHGNRAVSSPTGSADILEEIGIMMTLSHEEVAECLNEIGICFLFAPAWHPAMKHAAPVRKMLGVRTAFNLLGPITNPAPVTHQVVGVFDPAFLERLASALAGMGRKGAYLVHSKDGLDEVSIAEDTDYVLVKDSAIVEKGTIGPAQFGFKPMPLSELVVTDRQESVKRVQAILAGEGSETENTMVAANAALGYMLMTNESDTAKAFEACKDALTSGKAYQTLEKWQKFHNSSGSVTSVGS